MLFQLLLPAGMEIVEASSSSFKNLEVVASELDNENLDPGEIDPGNKEEEQIEESSGGDEEEIGDETEDIEEEQTEENEEVKEEAEELVDEELPWDENIFSNLTLTLNGEEYHPSSQIYVKDNDILTVSVDWAIDDGIKIVDGKVARLQLPSSLRVSSSLVDLGAPIYGEIISRRDDEIGRIQIDNELGGLLEFTFNDRFDNLLDRQGSLSFQYEINKKDFESGSENNLDFGQGLGDFDIIFKTDKGDYITKKGIVNNPNPKNIQWEIDVNTREEEFTSMKLFDDLPEGLELNGKIEIYRLNLDIDKNIISKSLLDTVDKFPIEFQSPEKAYRVIYNTSFNQEGLSKNSFTNKTNLLAAGISRISVEEEAEAEVAIERKRELKKSGSLNRESGEIEWTIIFNEEEMELSNVILEDTLSEGHEFVPSSIEINGIKNQDAKFPLELGNIGEKIVIKYKSKLILGENDRFGMSGPTRSNRVKLKADGLDELEKSASVTPYRDKLITKFGSFDPDNKIIHWTIRINGGNPKEDLGKIVVSDKLDHISNGLELKNISLVKLANEVLEEGQDYSLEKDKNSFTMTFNKEIGKEELLIQYETELKDDFNGDYATNDASVCLLDEEGNILEKECDSISSGIAINRPSRINKKAIITEEGQVKWRSEIQLGRNSLQKLVLKDSMTGGHHLEEGDHVKVYIQRNRSTEEEPLDEGRVKLKDLSDNRYNFTLEIDFTGLELAVNDKVLIDYHSSYKDEKPDDKLNNKIDLNLIYDGKNEDLSTNASLGLDQIISSGGKKQGFLDRDNKKIKWVVLLNSREEHYGQVILEDSYPEEEQQLDLDSLNLYSYEIEDGNIKIGDKLVDGLEYKLIDHDKENNTFKIVINDLYGKVMVVYDMDIVGIAQAEYHNTVKLISSNGLEAEYSASVKDPDYYKYLHKTGNINGNLDVEDSGKAYVGSKIDWKIDVNTSNSNINKAIFTDIISKGQKLLEDSIKVIKNFISNKNSEEVDNFKIDISEIDEGTELKVDFGDIEENHTIFYSTEVEADGGTIFNRAKLEGEGIEEKTHNLDDIEVIALAGGNGQGIEEKPVDPEEPGKPVDPEEPGKPVDPEEPGKPVDPEEPGKPVDPEEPGKPVDPEEPGKPVDPEEPGKPVDPEEPGKPVDPEEPAKPVDPEEPAKPVVSVPKYKIPLENIEELKENHGEGKVASWLEIVNKINSNKKLNNEEEETFKELVKSNIIIKEPNHSEISKLPQTGEVYNYWSLILALIFISLGLFIRKRDI